MSLRHAFAFLVKEVHCCLFADFSGRILEGGIISRRIESCVAKVMQKVGIDVAALVSDFAWA
jgi:hypothetical protein